MNCQFTNKTNSNYIHNNIIIGKNNKNGIYADKSMKFNHKIKLNNESIDSKYPKSSMNNNDNLNRNNSL